MVNQIYNYTKEEFQEEIIQQNIPKFRAKQVWNQLYKNNIDKFQEMSQLGHQVISELEKIYTIQTMEKIEIQKSKDGTQKAILKLFDNETIETVLMAYNHGYSVCVTTQIGCKIGCSFCASHLDGFTRNLTTGEIVEQVAFWNKILQKENKRVTHIVIMGIGEPLDNIDNVLKFIDIINDEEGFNIGARRITLSTSGITPKFQKVIEYDKQINLAVSLHAPNNDLRSELMKINKVYNIEEIMENVKEYLKVKNRQITFEYIMLNEVNDLEKHAQELANLIQNLNIHVNLIPYNSVVEYRYSTSTENRMDKFEEILIKNNISVTKRQKKGDDIDSACGQLRRIGKKSANSI